MTIGKPDRTDLPGKPMKKTRAVIELDDDVAVVFSNAKNVNNALRALITAMPQKAK